MLEDFIAMKTGLITVRWSGLDMMFMYTDTYGVYGGVGLFTRLDYSCCGPWYAILMLQLLENGTAGCYSGSEVLAHCGPVFN